jgi:hypothetical protein
MSRRSIDWSEIVEQAAIRCIRETLTEQTAAYWTRRAGQFRSVGTPTCAEIAEACENRAAFIRAYGDVEVDATLDDVLAELGEAS